MMPLWQDLYEDDEFECFGTWDECPNCGAIFGGDEYINQRCYACGWSNADETQDDYVSEDDDEQI